MPFGDYRTSVSFECIPASSSHFWGDLLGVSHGGQASLFTWVICVSGANYFPVASWEHLFLNCSWPVSLGKVLPGAGFTAQTPPEHLNTYWCHCEFLAVPGALPASVFRDRTEQSSGLRWSTGPASHPSPGHTKPLRPLLCGHLPSGTSMCERAQWP